MLTIPILLGWFVHRQRQPRWRLFFIGMVGFVLSQVFHIPFNWLMRNILPTDTTMLLNLLVLALFYGLSAGVFEEVTRYLMYRWMKAARTWGRGLMCGAGWGGAESMILGGLLLLNSVVLAAMSQGMWLDMIPEAQRGLLDEQIQAMLALPWYEAMLGSVERVFAMCLHLLLSLMVMQVFTRGKLWWLWLAIGWHALIDAVVVFVQMQWQNTYYTQTAVAIFALISLGLIFWLREPEPPEPELKPLPPVAPLETGETKAASES